MRKVLFTCAVCTNIVYLIIYISGTLKTARWQISIKRLLQDFHIQSGAVSKGLFLQSRMFSNTLLILLQRQPQFVQLKPHMPQLLNYNSCLRQLSTCFCTKSSTSNFENKTSPDLKKEPLELNLSHVDNQGRVQMVDVGAKSESSRLAVASAVVYLGAEAFHRLKENKISKGNVLTVAQLAGIMASKQTPNLMPLCHNIHITHAEVNLELNEDKFAVNITGSVNSVGRTGVEMESLTAVTVAALTVYDMCKAVSHDIVISDIKLLKKVGGKSGDHFAA